VAFIAYDELADVVDAISRGFDVAMGVEVVADKVCNPVCLNIGMALAAFKGFGLNPLSFFFTQEGEVRII
jgi:hypothetical protein